MRYRYLKTASALLLCAALSCPGAGSAVFAEAVEEVEDVEEEAMQEMLLDDGETGEAGASWETEALEEDPGFEEGEMYEGMAEDTEEQGLRESGEEAAAEIVEKPLWEYAYTYGGAQRAYLSAVSDWLQQYNRSQAYPDTGMIPAYNIIGLDDTDRKDIRVYGQFLIAEYAISGTTLVCMAEEQLTGCMHLRQETEDQYILTTAEVLDEKDRTGSAKVMADGNPDLLYGLLVGTVSLEEKMQAVRDFASAYLPGAEYVQYSDGAVRELYGGISLSPDYIAKSVEAEYTDQIITVGVRDTWNAVLMLHEKRQDGTWQCLMDVPALTGVSGLGKTREGDGRTPIGVYGVTEAFGLEDDPGAILPYTVCDEHYWWNSDSSSPGYNSLVRVDGLPDFSMEESEHIADIREGYRYAICLSYNRERKPYRGSAILLHCFTKDGYYTQGCISIPADAMRELICRIGPKARVIIDTEDQLKTAYLNGRVKAALSGEAWREG